jgi:predicted amidohydrolase YtcJ
MDPMRILWSAVNRLSDRGTPLYFEDHARDQRISPLEALRAVTIDAAWQLHLEDTRGSIEAGKFADLVILSENPLDNPTGIQEVEVLETIMGGRTVYSAAAR